MGNCASGDSTVSGVTDNERNKNSSSNNSKNTAKITAGSNYSSAISSQSAADVSQKAPKKHTATAAATETATTTATATPTHHIEQAAVVPADEDDEWRDTIRLVFLLMLDRLAQMLEFENETLAVLASHLRKLPFPSKPNGARAIDILSTETLTNIESFFTTCFDFEPQCFSPLPVDVASLSYPQLQLQRWIIAAQAAAWKQPVISRVAIATRVTLICTELRDELLQASDFDHHGSNHGQRGSNSHVLIAHSNPKLRQSLHFFARTFEFATRTNIVIHPQTLYSNIDVVCGEMAEQEAEAKIR